MSRRNDFGGFLFVINFKSRKAKGEKNMENITEFLLPIVKNINAYLSDYILIFLLVGVGVFYSIKTRFVQVRCFGEGMKKTQV